MMRKTPRLCVIILLCVMVAGGISAQSTADEIETLLGTKAVTYAQAARFVLDAANAITASDYGEAFRYASEQGWLPKNAAAGDAARLDGVAMLCMRSFDIKGGIFYRLVGRPLNAYRELVHRRAIIGRSDPAMKVSGDQLLFLISRLLAEQESIAREAEPPAQTAREAELAAQRALEEELAAQRAREEELAAQRAREEELAAQMALEAELDAVRVREVELAAQRALEVELAAARVREAELAAQRASEAELAARRALEAARALETPFPNIMFLGDSSDIPASETAKIEMISDILRNIPGVKVLVAGHTALAGSEAGRNRISFERAQAVASRLVSLGACKPDNITVAVYGAAHPAADNSTAVGMAANRRVEITILED